MQRYAIGIEFCGTQYRGWQTQQAGVVSVQETIEKVLSKIADHPVILHAAGRTDAGVHATNMVAHFDTTAIRPERGWLMGANSQLPKDISIQWIKCMDENFHARFKAMARRYRYVVYNAPTRPALLHKQVTHLYQELDVQKMI
ncbi:MAG: tRNA pseudouridine synthase A, partial [Acinetobacter junii]